MKVYIAARFSRRPQAYALAQALIAAGHEISCAWVMRHETHIMPPGLSQQAEDAERRRFAEEDIRDMDAADWCISLMDEPRGNGRGGRHVEFGYMLAKNARLTIIGPRETVFHHLYHVGHFDTVEEFLGSLNAPSPRPSWPTRSIAFLDGRAAALDGKDTSACDRAWGSTGANDWVAGWNDGFAALHPGYVAPPVMDINDRINRAAKRQDRLQSILDRAKTAHRVGDDRECMVLLIGVVQRLIEEVV